ncbi:UMP kinase, partial [Candidatus Woesearchaeota archaeon]|nr:UMP kinase [Candidatus Woesearchaeota archaeon]
MQKTFVISLGGSLIVPGEIDTGFLKSFKKVLESYIKKGCRFVIVCGGGRTARKYQEASSDVAEVDDEDLDWIGIMATRLNAYLVKTAFKEYAEDYIITDPTKKISFRKNILIAAGWKPGRSTDYDTVLIANQLKAREIINMSNVDYVYDKDPKKFRNAKPVWEAKWKDFRKLISGSWTAGLNAPFDPIAAEEAEKSGLKVMI